MKKKLIFIIGILMYFSGSATLSAMYGLTGAILGAICGSGAIIYTSASYME